MWGGESQTLAHALVHSDTLIFQCTFKAFGKDKGVLTQIYREGALIQQQIGSSILKCKAICIDLLFTDK